jgi:hypothetical protein
MNAERVSAKAVLAMGRIAPLIANMISVGGCASAGFAEAGALVPPTSVGGAPLVNRNYKETFVKCYKSYNIVILRLPSSAARRP